MFFQRSTFFLTSSLVTFSRLNTTVPNWRSGATIANTEVWCHSSSHMLICICKINLYCYRPPTKLWKDNVFSRVCVSRIRGQRGSQVTITHNALYLTIGPLRHVLTCSTWPSLYTDPPRHVQICSVWTL